MRGIDSETSPSCSTEHETQLYDPVKCPRKVVQRSFGTPGRIRTCDLLLRRQSLYPLSYRGVNIDFNLYLKLMPRKNVEAI